MFPLKNLARIGLTWEWSQIHCAELNTWSVVGFHGISSTFYDLSIPKLKQLHSLSLGMDK